MRSIPGPLHGSIHPGPECTRAHSQEQKMCTPAEQILRIHSLLCHPYASKQALALRPEHRLPRDQSGLAPTSPTILDANCSRMRAVSTAASTAAPSAPKLHPESHEDEQTRTKPPKTRDQQRHWQLCKGMTLYCMWVFSCPHTCRSHSVDTETILSGPADLIPTGEHKRETHC